MTPTPTCTCHGWVTLTCPIHGFTARANAIPAPAPATPESILDDETALSLELDQARTQLTAMRQLADELREALKGANAQKGRLRAALQRIASGENASRDPEALCTELCEIAHEALNETGTKAVS